MNRFPKVMSVAIGAAFVLALAMNVDARSPEPQLPSLPDSIPSQLGWVTVHRVPNLTCDGEQVLGCFEPLTRTLSIRDSMNLAVAWQTVRHEQVHMILFDAGIRIPVRGLEDVLADAIGAARVTEMVAERKR